MAPPGLFHPLDPTMHFLVGTFVTIVFIDADASAKTLALKLPTPQELAQHFLDPGVAIGLALFALFLYAVRDATKPLSRAQSLAANWHLWNSVLIYTMMDGLNGAFSEHGFLSYLHKHGYQLVDRRYHRALVDTPAGPTAYEAAVVQTLNATELFVYSWMSWLVAVGICKHASWHRTLEAVVLTMAAFGALLFVVPDYLTGCLNMQPFGEPGCMPPLTPFYFFFVYFGVVINWIWFAVPVAMLAKTVRDDFVSAAARPKTS